MRTAPLVQPLLGEYGHIRNLVCSMIASRPSGYPAGDRNRADRKPGRPGPYSSKGAGESGILVTSPVVGAAVHEAVGTVIRDLPLMPEKIWPPRRLISPATAPGADLGGVLGLVLEATFADPVPQRATLQPGVALRIGQVGVAER